MSATPYGYRQYKNSIFEERSELRAVQRMLDMRALGASYRDIGRFLYIEGHTPMRAQVWHAATIRRIVLRAQDGGYDRIPLRGGDTRTAEQKRQ